MSGRNMQSGVSLARVLIFSLPVAILLLLVIFLGKGLGNDPRSLPLAIQGQQFPAFRLPDLLSEELVDETIIQGPALVNIWATWCPTCLLEHEALTVLGKRGIPIYGINYKNDPLEARAFLNARGNPFVRVILDYSGQLGVELGMYGAPETYFVDSQNRVYYRHIGEISVELWDQKLFPIWQTGMMSEQEKSSRLNMGVAP